MIKHQVALLFDAFLRPCFVYFVQISICTSCASCTLLITRFFPFITRFFAVPLQRLPRYAADK